MSRLSILSVVPAIIALTCIAKPVHAQSWSAEQLEVWTFIQSQWDATMKKDMTWPDRMLHDRFLGWDNDVPAPRNKASTQKWSRYDMENSTTLVQELSPLGIVVVGNTAVAHYAYSVAAEDREGERSTTHGRYTDILLKDGNTWRFIAWHGGATSDEDDD